MRADRLVSENAAWTVVAIAFFVGVFFGVMAGDMLWRLAYTRAGLIQITDPAPYPSTPGFGASVSANASPNATMQATPSGLTRRTEKPPASLAVTIISAPVDVRPDTRGVSAYFCAKPARASGSPMHCGVCA